MENLVYVNRYSLFIISYFKFFLILSSYLKSKVFNLLIKNLNNYDTKSIQNNLIKSINLIELIRYQILNFFLQKSK